MSGTFRWEGVIIVTGNAVAVKVQGSDEKEIAGAILINETGPYSNTSPPAVDVQGAVRVIFSRAALANAAVSVRAQTLVGMYSTLPYELIQNYWRIVTP